MSRRCGRCRACCVEIPIAALDKAPHRACPLLGGSGCTVHATDAQPQTCQAFRCLWLGADGQTFGRANDRPDRIGIFLIPRPPPTPAPADPMLAFGVPWVQAVRTPAEPRGSDVPLRPRAQRPIAELTSHGFVVEIVHRFHADGSRTSTFVAESPREAQRLIEALAFAGAAEVTG